MLRSPVATALVFSSVVAALASACATSGSTLSSGGSGGAGPGATGVGPSTTSSGVASASSSGAGGTNFSGTGVGGSTSSGGSGTGGLGPGSACAVVTQQAKQKQLDLYIAFDRSSSMAGMKWDNGKAALSSFLNDASSAGIRVAINFFPLLNNNTCDQFAYKPPAAGFVDLPQNAADIITAMDAQTPAGFNTPVYPALGGAILSAIETVTNAPTHVGAVLLVTDGAPQGPAATCGGVNPEDVSAIASLAANGFAYKPSILTFVIGLPGIDVAFADAVAAAGGSGKAITVDPANLQNGLLAALAALRGQAVPCDYAIPDMVAGGQIDPTLVNVLVEPPGGAKTTIVSQDAKCAGGEGWYYDNPAKPTVIHLCEQSCKDLKADFGATVQILLGCKTEVAK